jgi:hypothetical protein
MTEADGYRKRAVVATDKSKARLPKAARKALLHKAQGLKEQADNQDWLDGKSVLPEN